MVIGWFSDDRFPPASNFCPVRYEPNQLFAPVASEFLFASAPQTRFPDFSSYRPRASR